MVSSVISFVCLIITVAFMSRTGAFESARYTTFRDTRIWTKTNNVTSLRLNDTCENQVLEVTKLPWTEEKGYVRGGLDSSRLVIQNQYLHLIWILAVSSLFQFIRYKYNAVSESKESGMKPWYDPRAFVLDSFGHYNPTGPDIGRWIEYALTSPWQIVIVAVNVGVEDFKFLLILWNLQCAMMLQGYLIELCIDKLWESIINYFVALSKSNSLSSDTRKKIGSTSISTGGTQEKTTFEGISPWSEGAMTIEHVTFLGRILTSICLGVWLQHATIWYIIITEYWNATTSYKECFDEGTPWFVTAIVFIQFILFTLFGIVQGIQCYRIYEVINTHPDDCSDVTSQDERKCLNNPTSYNYFHKQKEQSWLDTTYSYSLLSVVAKTSLDLIFIWGISVRV